MAVAMPQAGRGRTSTYKNGRVLAFIGAMGVVMAALWILNGYFTATKVMGVFHTNPVMGVAAHIGFSLLEIGLMFAYLKGESGESVMAMFPWWVHGVIWLVVLPLALFDLGSTAIGLVEFAQWMKWLEGTMLTDAPWWAFIGGGSLSFVICYAPDPVLAWLWVAFFDTLNHAKA